MVILSKFCAADSKPCLGPAASGCANWERSAEARSCLGTRLGVWVAARRSGPRYC